MNCKRIKEYLLKNQRLLSALAIITVFGIMFIRWGFDIISTKSVQATVLISIGTSLSATTISSIISMLFKEIDAKKQEKIDNLLNIAGIEASYEKRDLDDYDSLVKKASHSIDITGYSMRAFYQSYKEVLIGKFSNENFKVRMLFVNPNSDFSKKREQDEDQRQSGTYEASFVSVVTGLAGYKNVEIRTIDNNLGTMIFRIDDVMYIGPYLYKKSSKSTNTFCLNSGGWMFKEYQNEFDKMWNDAVPYKAENSLQD